ncbi:hypothetical protein H0X06_00290 [Candidatus Dependentiae bacterium]|nr:hypothetical protein [Candidatus Dependentiae bacterium]
MKRFLHIFLSVGILSVTGSILQAVASAGGDIGSEISPKTAVATCTQRNSKCAATVNAIGDVVTLDVKTLPAKDLGTITDEKKVTLELPKGKNERKLYSLTPTSGESKYTKIFVLFDNKEQPTGTRLNGQTVIMAYRQFEKEKSNQWVEVGRISSNVPLESAEVTLMPDGVAKVANPMKPTESILFNVGKKDFKS